MSSSSQYSIIPVCKEIFDRILKDHPFPFLVNEFFYIEALLRSSKAITAFSSGGQPSLQKLFLEHGILGHEALSNSHHILLLPPPAPISIQQDASDGDRSNEKRRLGDLAAPYNPSTPDKVDQLDDLLKAKLNDPRYLLLEIDLSHAVTPPL
jgi:hypothetical protein